MKVSIDAARCQGHGRCYAVAPGLFGADDEGYGQVLVADVAPEAQALARLAADNCPEGAVTVEG